MPQYLHRITNEQFLAKAQQEGEEYFFLDYLDIDLIADEDLRKNVQQLRLAWEEIMSVVDELEEEYYDKE